MSEYSTRNAYEFMRKHPNIYAGFHYHNTGRIIYFTAPPVVVDKNQTPEQRQRQEERINQRLEEMRKTDKYAQLFNRQVAPKYQEDLRVQTKIVSMGARILKNYRPIFTGGNGEAPSSTYDMLGAYSYLMELWGRPTFEADLDGDGRVSDEEYIKWIDIDLNEEGWINPHKVNHPDLGEIWIGGSRKKHMGRTPPSRYIEMEAIKNVQFVMYCVNQFPKVEIENTMVTPAAKDLFWVDVVVKNDRVYPTISDRSLKLKRIEKDKITLASSDKISIVEIPKGLTKIDPFDNTTQCEVILKEGTEFRLKGKQSLRFRALVKIDGSKGWIEFKVVSKHGGTVTKKIDINITN